MTDGNEHHERARGPLLTVPQVARVLQVTCRQVREWVRSGRLEGFKLGRRTVRVPQASVLRFVQASGTGAGASSAALAEVEASIAVELSGSEGR
ncbi:MAG: DNA-binding protein [Deltaproteobacteria bacterium]|nr:MAG: DNA-binding protein [Deltaproteobacteria bacterium]